MPGFAGIFSGPDPARRDRVTAMTRSLCRTGMSSAQCSFEEQHLDLAWATNEEPFQNAFAVWNDAHTALLVIAGEEFTAGNTNPAAVIRLYDGIGLSCVARLNGWFCGLLVDLERGSATLFNDRFGLGRVYYSESATDGFCFGMEAKALLAAWPQLRRLDERGVAEYVAFGCALQNRTLFRDVFLLPPASLWTFNRLGGIEKRRYFSPEEWENQPALDAAECGAALQEVFARATRRMFGEGYPVGISLTGGLDSRAVLAWTRADPGTLPCYTFGGPFRDCADVRIARELARLTGQPHTTIRVDDDFFPQFDALAERTIELSDGAMDITGAVELYVNARASGIAPVRLTGNYGSEIVRSFVALRPGHLDYSVFTPEFTELLEEALQTYHWEVNCHPLTFIAFKQVPWFHFNRFSVERSEICPRSPFLDPELVALAYRIPASLRQGIGLMMGLIDAGNSVLGRVGTDRAFRTRRATLASRIAVRWQSLTVKAEYAYDYGMPNWLAHTDRILAPLHVERLFLGRHKFYHFRVWYRDQLSSYVREHALAAAEPACFRPGAVRRAARQHLAGSANHTVALHKALSLQLIEQLFVNPR